MLRRLAAAALSTLLPAAATAFTLVDQQREVSLAIERTTRVCPLNLNFPPCPLGPPSQTTVENFSDSETAPDLADFAATVSVPGFSSDATLTSTVEPGALEAHGTRSASAPFVGDFSLPGGTMTNIYEAHDTASRYEMRFELTQPTSYTLTGSLLVSTNLLTPSDDVASLALTGPGGAVIAGAALDGDSCDFSSEPLCLLEDSVAESGMLAPGVYTLSAATAGHAAAVYSNDDADSGSFDVRLELSAPVVPALPGNAAVLLAALLFSAARRLR